MIDEEKQHFHPMPLLYHGTSAPLFGRFSLDHALQGDGKCKFGWGVYVTESRKSALHYARKSMAGARCNVYAVEVPDLTPDNHIAFSTPVAPSIVARVQETLGINIPAAAVADGKVFRKFVAGCFGGTAKQPTIAGEKAAAELLGRLGVVCIIWPFNWKKGPDGRFLPPYNRAVFDAAKIRIVSVEVFDADGHLVETIPADKLPR